MSEEDPRVDPPSVEEVPALLREGAEDYDAGRFWHAHEAWEGAWHALRGAGREGDAAFVQGMILVAAGFENLTRGKGEGFRRQMAQGLHQMRANLEAAPRVGLEDGRAWVEAVLDVYLDGVRRTRFDAWMTSGWEAPPLELER